MTWTTTGAVRTVERTIRSAVAGVGVEGLRQRDPGAVANAVVGLAGTFAPTALERRYGVEFRPWQRVYAQSAMLTHAVGMLGPYEDVWWWDHLTHVHSATLLGGVAHVLARRRDRDPRPWVLAAVLGGGVAWELVEYAIHDVADRLGVEPLLVPYGRVDTALDLVFDAIGALLVLAFGDQFLENFHRAANR